MVRCIWVLWRKCKLLYIQLQNMIVCIHQVIYRLHHLWPSWDEDEKFSLNCAGVKPQSTLNPRILFIVDSPTSDAVTSISNVNLLSFVCVQFRCCGVGVDGYRDWSYNAYFNCTADNPSMERCGVPYSCCLTPNDVQVYSVSLSLFTLSPKNGEKTATVAEFGDSRTFLRQSPFSATNCRK